MCGVVGVWCACGAQRALAGVWGAWDGATFVRPSSELPTSLLTLFPRTADWPIGQLLAAASCSCPAYFGHEEAAGVLFMYNIEKQTKIHFPAACVELYLREPFSISIYIIFEINIQKLCGLLSSKISTPQISLSTERIAIKSTGRLSFVCISRLAEKAKKTLSVHRAHTSGPLWTDVSAFVYIPTSL